MLRIEPSVFKSDGKTSAQQRDFTVTAHSQRGHVQQLSQSQSRSQSQSQSQSLARERAVDQMSQFPGSVSSDCPRPRCGYQWANIDRYLTAIVGQF